MMCRISAVIASWWKRLLAGVALGAHRDEDAAASSATKKVAVHERTAKVSTGERAAPARVVMSHVRPTSVSTM